MPPIVIGVAGGSGSGKSTVVRAIVERLGPETTTVLHHDSYYFDRGDIEPDLRGRFNYDHPDSLETTLLIDHLRRLCAGRSVEVPVYDYASRIRMDRTETAHPRPVIIVDGILILWERELRELMDIKLFVDTDPDIRFIRRLERDVRERGRSMASVIEQYRATVRPMHREFVEPSKRSADLIIPRGGHNEVAIGMIVAEIRSRTGTDPQSSPEAGE